jgi:monofunctional biosynthetic peptidoglycan transglycosylase
LCKLLLLAALIPSSLSAQEQSMKLIVDFAQPGSTPWSIVNDDVMGGRSTSKMEVSEHGSARFEGFVSLENNGGFASTRAAFQSLNLSGYAGVILKVRGDGRRYQLRFRTDDAFDGVAYRATFDTASGEWLELKLRFADFEASYRGSVLSDVGPLDPARIRQMGFLIADKKEGPFRLEIAWVKAADAEALANR